MSSPLLESLFSSDYRFAVCSRYPDAKLHVTEEGETTLCGREVRSTKGKNPITGEAWSKNSCSECKQKAEEILDE